MREQEKEVYRWVFVGCGRKEDYDIMTKLGDGMFGYKETGEWNGCDPDGVC